MISKIQTLPAYIEAQKKFEAMSGREQNLVKIMSVVAFVVVLYFAMWAPAKNYMDDAASMLEQRQQLFSLIQQNRSILKASDNSGTGSKKILDSQQLVSSVTNMAKQNQLTLKRFEPSGESKVKVWVEDVSFNSMIAWLTQLQQKLSIQVEQVSIEKNNEEGKVSARLTLSS